jgi:hypothetical protein
MRIKVVQDGKPREEEYMRALELAKQQEKGLISDVRFFVPNTQEELYLLQVYGRDKLGRIE